MTYQHGHSLGDLIRAFQALPDHLRVIVETPDGWAPAGRLGSYRGTYAHLMIDIEGDRDRTVAEFRRALNNAVGSTFQGWKGGDYMMDADTPVYLARFGESSGVQVADVRENGDTVELHGFRLAELTFW